MQTFGRTIAVAAVAAAAFGLTACGSEESETAASATTAAVSSTPVVPTATESKGRECVAEDIGVVGGFGQAPTITIPDDCDPPSTLITKDLVPGSGPGATAGQQLTMNYSLVTWSDKQKLDSSFDRGEPFRLTLGAGMVYRAGSKGSRVSGRARAGC